MGGKIDIFSILVSKTEGKRQSGRNIIDGTTLLKWNLKKWNGDMSWLCTSG
jgi:hypothetical protein